MPDVNSDCARCEATRRELLETISTSRGELLDHIVTEWLANWAPML